MSRKAYTPEEDEAVRLNHDGLSTKDLAALVSKVNGTPRTINSIICKKHRLGIASGYKAANAYSKDELDLIHALKTLYTLSEITDMVNARFGKNRSVGAIRKKIEGIKNVNKPRTATPKKKGPRVEIHKRIKPSIWPRDLILAMSSMDTSADRLAKQVGLSPEKVRVMMCETGVPKEYAHKFKEALGI